MMIDFCSRLKSIGRLKWNSITFFIHESLQDGKYPTLARRLLGITLVRTDDFEGRDIGYSYLSRYHNNRKLEKSHFTTYCFLILQGITVAFIDGNLGFSHTSTKPSKTQEHVAKLDQQIF